MTDKDQMTDDGKDRMTEDRGRMTERKTELQSQREQVLVLGSSLIKAILEPR